MGTSRVLKWHILKTKKDFLTLFNISYIEIIVHLDLNQIFVHELEYLQKVLVNAKCFFHPEEGELKFRYPMCFILQN